LFDDLENIVAIWFRHLFICLIDVIIWMIIVYSKLLFDYFMIGWSMFLFYIMLRMNSVIKRWFYSQK
jgi:hypothetical protein